MSQTSQNIAPILPNSCEGCEDYPSENDHIIDRRPEKNPCTKCCNFYLPNSFIYHKLPLLYKKGKECCKCKTECEHVGSIIVRGKSKETKTYCCICLPYVFYTKAQEEWICPTCFERQEKERIYQEKWQCKDCKNYVLNKKEGYHQCKFSVDYDAWNHDCPQFKPKKPPLSNRGRIVFHLKRCYDLTKRASYAPALLEKIENITGFNEEILDDLIEAHCELVIGQVMRSNLIYGRSKKNTIIVPCLVINSEKVYEVDIPLSSDPRNYKPRNKPQVFYEMLEDHINLGGDSQ